MLGQGARDIESAAINSPAGIYHMVGEGIHHPSQLLTDIYNSYKADLEHPLRHPGYTALDVLGLGTGAGAILDRGLEAGRVVGGTSRWADVAKPIAHTPEAETAVLDQLGPMTPGRQLFQAVLHGSPEQRRLIAQLEKQPGTRFGRASGEKAITQEGKYFSRNLTIRSGQKLMDQLHETFPEVRLPGVWANQGTRIGRARRAAARIETGLSRREALLLVKKYGGKKTSAAEHEAVAMVLRGVRPIDQITFLKGLLAGGKLRGYAVKRTQAWLDRTAKAAQYIDDHHVTTIPSIDKDGKVLHPGDTYVLPKIKDEFPHLQSYVEDARFLSNSRTKSLLAAGALSPEEDFTRRLASKNVIEGRGVIPDLDQLKRSATQLDNIGQHDKAAAKRAELNYWLDRLGQEPVEGQMSMDAMDHLPSVNPILDPELAKHLARVPEKTDFGAQLHEFFRPYKGGKVQEPGSLTHAYTGHVLTKLGGPAPNTAKLVAESYIEAQRFMYLTALRAQLLASAQDTPKGIPEAYRLPIVEDTWKGNFPPGFAFAQDKFMNGVGEDDAEAAGRWFEPLRQILLEPQMAVNHANEWYNATFKNRANSPSMGFLRRKGVPTDVLNAKDLENMKIPGIKWLDRRSLGGLDKQNPLWGAMDRPGVRTAMHAVDVVNEAQKTMLLYLKPSYAFPNMLGNVALTIVHQGFLAPLNLAKTLRIMFTGKGLSKEASHTIKAAMGGGASGVLRSTEKNLRGYATTGGNFLAAQYGKVIDDPFRFSAFLHEARVAGFTSLKDVEKLTTDPAYATNLREVARRANDALIDYEDLGPGEQAILRRLIFFYPWVKGSSKYAYQMAINHPVATSLTGQAGKTGEDWIARELGAVPTWLEGVIPLDHGNKIMNPTSAGILGEPGLAMENVQNFFNGPRKDISFFDSLAPADSAGLALLTGFTSVGHDPNEKPIITALKELEPTPLFGSPSSLYESLTGGPSRVNSIYNGNSKQEALFKYALFGGLTPRTANKNRINYSAYLEDHPHG